ncbi:patatin-like phospholipase family protein [Bacillus thermotolerans]|uniref:Patatin-like phospholipase n=1 Tax=Bacillus thermotolerans TaxID=1221996 RepID=A0A0F5IB06_BACTR|nr:patatin family protein [Bacillus thermotolerans]KKB42510.1 Patatin-like phospholipase [Bacillus thermotolerans]
MLDTGLILEGGGMRGLYTAGILESFMEQDLYFPYVIGVSAGACMAASYLSRQPGRNKEVNIGFAGDKRYLSFRNFITKRELFGMDFLFEEIPERYVPFDYETYKNSPEKFVIAATDCTTGEAVYFEKDQHADHLTTLLRASSSLPFIAPSVAYDNRLLLDGGIVDPIPVKKAQNDGYKKNIIVLTKPPGYRKQPPGRMSSFIKSKKYPVINKLLATRYKLYNDTLDYIYSEEEKGNVFIIQPSVAMPVGRVEKNKEKLERLYELGRQDAQSQMEKLQRFLSKTI